MDTSPKYIEMCDCEEIQSQAIYVVYNFFIDAKTLALRFSDITDYDYMKTMNALHTEREYLWLPRQDQIQEMFELPPIGDERFQVITPFGFAYKLYNFAEEIRNPNKKYPYGSMEQLWLAFYMDEKHNKQWDKNKWR